MMLKICKFISFRISLVKCRKVQEAILLRTLTSFHKQTQYIQTEFVHNGVTVGPEEPYSGGTTTTQEKNSDDDNDNNEGLV